MNIVFFQAAFFLYFIGAGISLAHLVTLRPGLSRIGRGFLAGGLALHSLAILWRIFESGRTPLTNLHEALSFFAWATIGVYLLLHFKYRIEVLGAFVSPVAVVLMVLASLFPKEIVPVEPVLNSFWLPIHVTLAIIGNAMFALAFAAGVMYLIQERQIKSKKIGVFYRRLPALQVLDDLNYRCLTLGFPLLTLGIITGSIWAESAWGTYWSWDPKQTWSLITWFLYAALLHGRLTVGWRGRRAAIFAVCGFCFLVFTFLGVNLLISGLHGFK
jgi:cytochrome c-type biogenesis protein CcsB